MSDMSRFAVFLRFPHYLLIVGVGVWIAVAVGCSQVSDRRAHYIIRIQFCP